MNPSLTVRVHGIAYPIFIGTRYEKEWAQDLATRTNGKKIAIITDTIVKREWSSMLLRTLKKHKIDAQIFTFASGESNKIQKTVTSLQHLMLKKKYGRDTLIIAFGGGVVGDMAGFVASTYMRGVPFVQLPTTLLAMVDSSIGGKVGIDTPFGKNTIGAVYQPIAVYIDTQFLSTLPRVHIVNGMIEAIKTFLISDKSGLLLPPRINIDKPLSDTTTLETLVLRSLRVKASIVMRDEHEENERMTLNYGHTIGHAIELLSKYKLLHGYAVGIGCIIEAHIARLAGKLSQEDCATIEKYFEPFGITGAQALQYGNTSIITATKSDKKAIKGKVRYVLLEGIGKVCHSDGEYAHTIDDKIVIKSLSAVKTLLPTK